MKHVSKLIIILALLSTAPLRAAEETPLKEPTKTELEAMSSEARSALLQRLCLDLAFSRETGERYLADEKRGICRIHQRKLTERVVKIEYGIPGPVFGDFPELSREFVATAMLFFPHSADKTSGGCVVSRDSPKTTKVLVCADCLQAKKEWMAAHAPKTERK